MMRVSSEVSSTSDPSIRISSCRSPGRFLDVQREFYRGDPNYVPPLTLVDRWKITPRIGAFMRSNEVGFFIAHRDHRPVGRISTTRNQAHDEFHGDRVGFFGHFEARDDRTAHALLDHAIGWLRARGATSVRGPIDLSTNYRCALVVGGEADAPVFMMPHNPPEYRDYLESYGLQEVKRLLSFGFTRASLRTTQLEAFVEKLRRRTSIRVRPVRLIRYGKDVRLVASIYDRIWQGNWGFAPFSVKEFLQEIAGLRLVCPPELFQIAFAGDEPIGFALVVPDLNPAIQACDGRLLPLGWWTFFREVKRLTRARAITLGVVPEYRKSGADALLFHAITQQWLKLGFKEAEASWVLEDNHTLIRMLDRLGATVKRQYSVFGMDLESLPAERIF